MVRNIPNRVLVAHVAATLYMVGLIWFVQIVHYPLFGEVGHAAFIEYEAAHIRLTSWVVMPPMLLELVTAAWLVWARPQGIDGVLAWAGGALLVLVWVSTFALQVPLHNTLVAGFDASAHSKLVLSNWIRTAAWSARGIIVLIMLERRLK